MIIIIIMNYDCMIVTIIISQREQSKVLLSLLVYVILSPADPERQHRRCGGQAFRRSCAHSCDLWPAFAPCKWSSRGYCPVNGWGKARQLDLPSLTPLSVADCGRLQMGAVHWSTSVALLQVVYK